MLFILSQDIRSGKTRWLSQVVQELENLDFRLFGVLAPGIWKQEGEDFIKLGINNLLLPSHELIPFALTNEDGCFNFNEKNIALINSKLKLGAQEIRDSKLHTDLFIFDEIGWLELEKHAGLYEGLQILQNANPYIHHALIVVRVGLLGQVKNRFNNWGEEVILKTDLTSKNILLSALQKPKVNC